MTFLRRGGWLVVLVSIGGLPIAASGAPHLIALEGMGGGSVRWTTEDVQLSEVLRSPIVDGRGIAPDLIADLEIVGGSGLSVTGVVSSSLESGELFSSDALYEGGLLRMNASWELADGALHTGTFEASILDLKIHVRENCGFVGLPCGDMSLMFGEGYFSRELASLLNVSRHSPGGRYVIALDFITPLFDDFVEGEMRVGRWNGSYIEIVPEPSLLTLAALGWVCAARRRRQPTYVKHEGSGRALAA
jgi:hypothetical protein